MPRPQLCRNVAAKPGATYFKPAGIPLTELEEVTLGLDEIEAIRLNDLEGLGQDEAADKMGISQPTFHRLLQAAHAKIAEALVNGKALRIEGGNVRYVQPRGRCRRGAR